MESTDETDTHSLDTHKHSGEKNQTTRFGADEKRQ